MSLLKVDIDGPLPKDMDVRIAWVMRSLSWPVRWVSYYKTRHGWHVEVSVSRSLHMWRIIAAQSILGSDYRRETFNLKRAAQWRSLPVSSRKRLNVLFTRKIGVSGMVGVR